MALTSHVRESNFPRSRSRVAAMLAGAAAVLAVAGATNAAPTATASYYLSPSGSDANPCTQAAPCRSLDRAYRVASPGQTVELAGGSYGNQTINVDGAKTSAADVVFRPAAGANVTLGGLDVYGKHVELQDMTLGGWDVYPGADDVTFRDLTVRGGIFIMGGNAINIIGGSVGPGVDYHPQIAPYPIGSPITNILIDGVEFHDWTRSNDSVHTECLQIAGGNGVIIRNSVFRNCAVMDLSITEYNGSGPPTNYTIENNFFAPSIDGGYYSLQFNSNASALRNILIRNNSSTQEFLIDNGQPTISNVRVVANIAPIVPWLCSSRITYVRNVWQGATCSSSDRNAPAGFRNPGALDYHLTSGAAAIDYGDPTNYPALDIDGQARPAGAGPDAGADEAAAATPPPPPPPTEDTTAPSTPGSVRASASTATSITLAWNASTDNVGVTGYGVYRNNTSVGSTAGTTFAVTGLACNTSYTLAVDAYDAAGNRSAKGSVTASTAACPDSIAPSAPTGLTVTATTPSSVSVSWTASSDNVGVTGYGAYVNGVSAGSATSTSHTFAGLACETSYTLAVDAVDGSGNRSAKTTVAASTGACPNLRVSPTGADTAACLPTAPCRTLNRAYAVAQPGQIVEMAAGTYPAQTINTDSSHTSLEDVVIKPVAGAAVTTGALAVKADHVEVRDITVATMAVDPGATDVTLRNLTSGGMSINQAADVSVIGGSVTGGTDTPPVITSGGTATAPRNIVLDGVTFKDWRTATAGVEMQCLLVDAANGLTIRNSRFRNCEFFSILLRAGQPAGTPTNVTIENNFLDCCGSGWYSIYLGDGNGEQWKDVLVRNNSTNKMMGIGNGGTTVSNVRFFSNVGPGLLVNIGAIVETSSCVRTGVTTDWNVWSTGPKCGANDLISPSGFVDAANFDFHLNAASAAIGRGNPASVPATDIDGQSRPQGAAPDAGADETAAAGSADTTAPSVPANFRETADTATSVTVAWNASTDNVGVTGYGLYRNGTLVASTAGTSSVLGGLACGTSYTLAVDATDAAGNRSAKAQISAATEPCGVFVSPTGNDANACTSSAPCLTFNRAYQVATPGTTVEVAAGTYPAQTINADASHTSASDVVIKPAAGAAVTLNGDIVVNGSHVEIRDMTVGGITVNPGASDVTFRNLTDTGGLWINQGESINLIGGSIGGGVDRTPTITAVGSATPPRNVVIDGVTFKDWRSSTPSGDVQCLRVEAADGLTIRNSKFRNCELFGILLVGGTPAGAPTNVTIENNFVECCAAGWYSIYLGDGNGEQWRNIVVRHNSTNKMMAIGNGGTTVSGVRFSSNVGPGLLVNIGATVETSSCVRTGVTTDWNVWSTGPKCGANDLIAPLGFVDASAGDFHLVAGSAAIDRGEPASGVGKDIDGQTRPLGGGPDAGADEKS